VRIRPATARTWVHSAVITAPSARVTAGTALGVSALLVVVHATNDAFGGMLSALLPTLQVRFGLSETALALFVATLSFSSSVTQPVMGVLTDRWGRRRMAALGVITSSSLLSLMAVAPSPWLLFLILLVGGLGSAAFHPAGTGIARSVGGSRKGLVMSVFSAGGIVGVAVGPLVIGWLLMTGNLSLSPLLMIPGVLGGLALIAFVPAQPRPRDTTWPPLLDLSLLRGPVGVLAASGILRSISFVTFLNAMPLYLVTRHGLAPDSPVLFWTLTTFSLSAAAGGIVAGALERRVSRPLLITTSMLLSLGPFGLLFLLAPGTPVYFLTVAVAGALVNAGLPLMIVAAQDLAPHAMGAASGLLMGFTWGTAGLLYVAVGALQEAVGLGPAMAAAFLTLIPAALLANRVIRRDG
jgi:MFS transporter, FSR family, fosmidomycin resistance protein